MTLPLAITPGDPGHVDDHEEAHTLLGRLDGQTAFTATGVSQGLLADRPAAAASNEGLIYHATDVPATFYSDGSTWTQWVLSDDSVTWTGIHNHDEDVFFGSGRPWVDVMHEDFGATGDDVTDDGPAIQAAINTGFVIYLPEPDVAYRVANTLNLISETMITGTGRGCQVHYVGTGFCFENPNKGTSTSDEVVSHVYLDNFELFSDANGIDLHHVQFSRIGPRMRVEGNSTIPAGSIGISIGGSPTSVSSWWNRVEPFVVRHFETGVKGVTGANRILIKIDRLWDQNGFCVDLDDCSGVQLELLDVNPEAGSGSTGVRINGDSVTGYIQNEGTGNDPALHLDSGATNYDLVWRNHGATTALQRDSIDGVLQRLRTPNGEISVRERLVASYEAVAQFYDDFLRASLGANWASSGASVALAEGAQAHRERGIVTLTTGASSNDEAQMNWGGNFLGKLGTGRIRVVMAVRLAQTTQFECQFGLTDRPGDQLATDDTLFFANNPTSSVANWSAFTSEGGTSGVDSGASGVAGDTDRHIFRIDAAVFGSSEVKFYIDDVLVHTATTNIPDGNLQPFFYIRTKEAVAKSVHVDWVMIDAWRDA